MSRNLARSSCCDNVVRLPDIIGRPIEVRRSGPYAPVIGTRWDCPTCTTAYFVIWRTNEENRRGTVNPQIPGSGQEWLGTFTLDLSYYESYNDEHGDPEFLAAVLSGELQPSGLVVGAAEDAQWVW